MKKPFQQGTAGRGRPPGQEPVVQSRNLRLHELSLMRAVVQGMRPVAAARRYMPELHADVRVVRTLLRELVRNAQQHLLGLDKPVLAQALSQALPVRVEAEPTCAVKRPSLEQFAQECGLDMLSESELIELYEQEYQASPEPRAEAPVQSVGGAAACDHALRGLSLLQSRGVLTPSAEDALSQWLSPRLCAQLQPFGVLTLAELMTFINMGGRTWWRVVPGLGRDRAGRLFQWLLDHKEQLGDGLSVRVLALEGSQQVVGVRSASSSISLRSTGPNALGASDDIEAIQTWLKTLTLKSPHTLAAYRRDVERLLRWAHERGQGLSSLKVPDAIDHAHFLLEPPAHWVNPLPASRDHADWRPMRGPLSVASANRALASIGHLYRFLVESGYLLANPFASVRSVPGIESAQIQLDTTRSFGKAHVEAMQDELMDLEDGPSKRRLLALLSFAESTGLRRMELTGHIWDDLRKAPEDETGMYLLRVIGKGRRERQVPIRPSVVEQLKKHLKDRLALSREGLLPVLSDGQYPLLSVLELGPTGRLSDPAGHLSGAGVHRVLKAFFRQVAKRCVGETAESFERASCHWLRHTFAHQVLKASGNDLPVTQQLLDHRNLSTTGLYLKADLGQRIEAVRALEDVFP